jgi:hypothetical protein
MFSRNVRAARLQQCNDLVGKPVLEIAVAETQQFIDLPHDVQSTGQAVDIAMQIGDDAELHEGVILGIRPLIAAMIAA